MTPDVSGNKEGRTDYDLDRWHRITSQTAQAALINNWSMSEVAKRCDVPQGTFSPWYHGKYGGRLDKINSKVSIWLEALEEAGGFAVRAIAQIGFVPTRTAKEFQNTMAFAHQAAKLVIITADAGIGKTESFEHYQRTRPHVFLVTISPHTKTVHGMLTEIAAAIGLNQHNPAKLVRGIGEFLSKSQAPTLLIVDEAQNLQDQAVDQLRHFCDQYRVGVVIGGNTEIYGRFSSRSDGPSYAQIKRRVAKRIKRSRAYTEDIDLFLDAWKITDPEMRTYLHGIGTKDGALGSINNTLEFATVIASGEQKPLSLSIIKTAWRERDMEGL
jgi:hypothetical protein